MNASLRGTEKPQSESKIMSSNARSSSNTFHEKPGPLRLVHKLRSTQSNSSHKREIRIVEDDDIDRESVHQIRVASVLHHRLNDFAIPEEARKAAIASVNQGLNEELRLKRKQMIKQGKRPFKSQMPNQL